VALSVGALVAYLNLDTSRFDSALEESQKGLDKMPVAVAATGAAVGVALAAGVAGAMDMGDANAKLSAQLGLSQAESARIGKAAGSIYAGNYGDSLDQVNEAVKGVMQNISGMSTASAADLDSITKNVLSVSSAFDQDLGATTAAVGQLMKTGLAPDAKSALDIVTAGFQNGNDKAGDWLDTLNEYGTQFRKMGLSGQEATGLISQGLKNGARDGDLVADAIKEFSIRAVDGSTTSAAGFQALGLSAKDMTAQIAKGGDGAKAGLDTVLDRLRAMKDPVQQSAAATALFGTQAEDLGAALYAIDPSTAVSGLGQVAGAADKVNATLGATASSNLESFKRQAQVAFVDVLGGQVLPAVTKFATFLSANLGPALDDGAAAFLRVTGFIDEHRDTFTAIAAGIATLLVPALIAMGVQATISAAKTAAAWLVTQAGAVTAMVAQSAAVVETVAGWVLMGAQSLIQAARMAAAWVIAMGPIGWVAAAVIGIVALVVTHWDTVSKATSDAWGWVSAKVTEAWGWIKDTVSSALDWVVGFVTDNWPLLVGLIGGPLALAVVEVVKHWDEIKATISNAWAWVRDNVLVPLGTFVMVTVPGYFTTAAANVARNWDGIKASVAGAWDWTRDNVLVPLGTFVMVTVPGYFTSAKDAAGRAWDGIKGAVSGPIDWVRRNVFDPWYTMMTVTVPGYFSSAVSAIGKAWDGLQDAAKRPVRFLVDTVINGGLVDNFNKIAGLFGARGIDRLALPRGFETGGYTGDGGKHEPMGVVHGGEYVFTKEETKRAGVSNLARLAQSLRGYADGGLVDLGHQLQAKGFAVTEHPAFGGVHPVHAKGSQHYVGNAIDVNHGAGTSVAEQRAIDAVVGGIKAQGFQVLWRVADHFNHMHVAGRKGILGRIGDVVSNAVSSLGDLTGPFDAIVGKLTDGALSTPFGQLAAGAARKLVSNAKDYVSSKAAGLLGNTPGGADVGEYDGATGKLSPADARAAGRSMLPAGWSWPALDSLWTKESGWRWDADNPGSSAYGIPQALPGSKMRSAGADWATNAVTQEKWGLGYIADRYGNSQKAWAHSQANNWYANGTSSAARGLAVLGEHGPELVDFRGGERVYTNRETKSMLAQAPIEKHLHYYAATGRVLPEDDLADATSRARMLGW
jgi:phage-related minor tail protein